MTKISLGISTCPNDTFMFHGIIAGAVDLDGFDFDIRFCDVQALNTLIAKGEFDCSKASYHAALHVAEDYGVLNAGSALGDGVGPVVVSRRDGAEPSESSRILCPGAWTTAKLLFQLVYPQCQNIEHCVFSEIMPRVAAGSTDFGVLIHEGRFTYQTQGLSLTTDLGDRWSERTQSPIPLGCILASKSLGASVHRRLDAVIRRSIEYAFANREETVPTMREHAQELSMDAIWEHVRLYVNEYSLDLGAEGREAIGNLETLARQSRVIGPEFRGLEVFD